MAEKGRWITKDGRRIFIRDGGRGKGVVVAGVAEPAIAGGAGGAAYLPIG